MSGGLSFAGHLSYGGSRLVDVDAAADQGPTLSGAKAVRFTAAPGNSGTVYYKGGDLASTLDDTASGDSTAAGIPLAAGANSGWLPGNADDYYLDASAANQGMLIEWMI